MVQKEQWPDLKEFMKSKDTATQKAIWRELNSGARTAITKAWRAMDDE